MLLWRIGLNSAGVVVVAAPEIAVTVEIVVSAAADRQSRKRRGPTGIQKGA